MGISNYELSQLAEKVYSANSSFVEINNHKSEKIKWLVDGKYTRSSNGFYCELYFEDQNDTTKDRQAVLAFRGTEPSDYHDLLNDIDIIRLKMPKQAYLAIEVAKDANANYSNLTLVGHSLGGGLAIIASAHVRAKAVTFNAPGVAAGCLFSAPLEGFSNFMSVVKTCLNGNNVNNIRVGGDLVSTSLLPQVGKQTTIEDVNKCTGTFNALCKHEIQTVSDTLKNYHTGASGSW